MGLFDASIPAPGAGWINPTDPSQNVAIATPDDIKARLAMAQALQQQGMSTAPIKSGWQGAAQLAQALAGTLAANSARSDQAAGVANNRKMLASYLQGLGGGDPPAPTPGSLAYGLANGPGSPSASAGGGLPTFALGQGSSPAVAPAALATAFGQKEQQYGLPTGYLSRTAGIESGFDPSASNPSGAAGLFEFMPKTAKAYGLQNPFDPVASTDAAARLASDNAAVLRQGLGREPTAGELYLAHQQGATGALKLLSDPNASAASAVGANAVTANGGRPGMTAGQFASQWTGKFPAGAPAAGGGGLGPLGMGSAGGAPAPQLSAYMGPGGTISPANLAAYEAARGGAGGTQVASATSGFVPSAGGATMPAGVPGPSAYAAPGASPSAAPGASPSAAPAQQAISGATGGAAPYGSQPLNLNGHMLTRQQAEDSTGLDLDGTDYDAAAAKLGMTPRRAGAGVDPSRFAGTVPIAPSSAPPASSSVITGTSPDNPAPSSYAVTHGANVERTDAGIAPVGGGNYFTPVLGSPQPAARSGQTNRAALLAYLSDPFTTPAMAQIATTLLSQADKQESWQTVKDASGSVWQRNSVTGEMKLLQDANKQKDDATTPDIRNYQFYTQQAVAAGQTPMPFDTWSTQKARAGAAQGGTTIIDQKGEGSEAMEAGKLAATRRGDMLTAADAAPEKIARLQMLGDVLARTQTGPLAGTEGTVVSVANQLGISPDTIKGLGLDPNQAVNNQVAQKLGNELVAGSIGAKNGGFPASNFSVAERQFIEKMFPNIASQPGSNQAVTDVLIAREERNLQKADEWSAYKQEQRSAGKPVSYEDFEDQWAARHAKDNIFAPIIQKFNAGAYGPVGAAPPTPNTMNAAPGAPASSPSPAAPPMQGARQAPDGNWYVADPNRPGKFLRVQ